MHAAANEGHWEGLQALAAAGAKLNAKVWRLKWFGLCELFLDVGAKHSAQGMVHVKSECLCLRSGYHRP